MVRQSNSSAFLFKNVKSTLRSQSKVFDVSTPVNDGIAIINVEGDDSFRLISANEVFVNFIQKQEQDPIGCHVNSLTWGDHHEDGKLQQHLVKSYALKQPTAFIWQLTINDTPLNLLCKIIPLHDREGNVSQITVTTCDYDDAENLEIEVSKNNNSDALTGLTNRFKFFETLDENFKRLEKKTNGFGEHQGLEGAVLFVNINKIQRVNECYGYEFGDRVICSVADTLKEIVHEKSLIARFTNDKFVIYLSDEHFENLKREAMTLANSIHHTFESKPILDDSDLRLSVSIGIAIGKTSSKKIERLMQNAHTAMTQNQNLGSNKTIIFNQDLKTQAVTKLRMETEFREALEKDALELHYQPLVNLQNGLISGFEALARWQNSSRGSISPLEFIALAEEAGLIIPLGEWALNTACEQLKKCININPLASSLFMAVNVSSSHIMLGNIAALTRDALAKSGLDGANLKLELTESTIMENSDIARNILLDLKTHGISLAVDDFGTGYSSLSYLSRIPADTIKIDRSFISKMDTSEEGSNIIKVIINLAKSLGMTIIAEGIETATQLNKLRALGCHYGQGYYFSRAVKADEISDLISEQPYKSKLE